MQCGVPQGSVVYIHEIGDILRKHGVQYVLYADDLQIFVSCPRNAVHTAILRLESCIKDIQEWLLQSKLVLNPGKIEFIILGDKRPFSSLTIRVAGVDIQSKTSVRDLGVTLDPSLSFDNHLNSVCRNALFRLRVISRQRFFLEKNSAALLTHAFIISRLDFCASLLCGISIKLQKRLQNI
jgi:hypothetical protein